jgi:hypothetical protein
LVENDVTPANAAVDEVFPDVIVQMVVKFNEGVLCELLYRRLDDVLLHQLYGEGLRFL